MPINHIFFHDDIDGIISAAIFLYYNINDSYRLYPLSSSMRGEKFRELFLSITKTKNDKKIILDYQYHKDADLWIDHHFDPIFGECLIKNENIIYDPKRESAADLVITLREVYCNLPFIARDLDMVNIIDSGNYKSIDQIFKDKSSIMILRAYLERTYPAEMTYCRIVEVIAYSKLNMIDALSKLKIGPYYVKELEKNALQIKDLMVIIKKMSIVNQKRTNQFPRYSEYLVYPKIKYALRLTPVGNHNVYFQIGFNNWQKEPNKFNIGKMLLEFQKDYIVRGGGHFNVGAGIIKDEFIDRFIDDISKVLNEED